MSKEITVKFRSVEDAEAVDLTRVGLIAGGSEDGLTVVVEPDIYGWDHILPEVRQDILESGLAAAGYFVEITDR